MIPARATTADEILRRYAEGERYFANLDLDGADFSGVNLEGITFYSCYMMASFYSAHLQGATFEECNVKIADFRRADLRNARFLKSLVCGIQLDGALTDGVDFGAAGYYGFDLKTGDIPL